MKNDLGHSKISVLVQRVALGLSMKAGKDIPDTVAGELPVKDLESLFGYCPLLAQTIDHGFAPGMKTREELEEDRKRQEKLISDIRKTCNTLLIEKRIARGTAEWGDNPPLYAEEAEAMHPLRTKSHERYALAAELLDGRQEKADIVSAINLVLAAGGFSTREEFAKAVEALGQGN